MTADWIDVTIRSTVDAGELLGLLADASVQGAWQDESVIHLYWPEAGWSPARLSRLEVALRQLEGAHAADPEILVQSLPNRDWNRRWAESVKPLRVGRRIVIRPSWEQAGVRPGQIEIVLDPKQAFGTGHHATTRLLLEWLEDIVRGGESILDVGTGSGLLAMAALRLGASQAIGIDNDPVAVECAWGYARENGFGDELSLRCGVLDAAVSSEERRADLVLANLDRRTLLALAEELAACTGRRILVSGILSDQRQDIVEAFAGVGLYPGQERERDGWLAMEFTPAQSCEGA